MGYKRTFFPVALISVVLILFTMILIYGRTSSTIESSPTLKFVDTQKLNQMINNKEELVIIDLREPELFEEGRVESSINIPFENIQERYYELPKNKKIVFVCHTGRMGAESGTLLLEKGYTQVFNLDGGIAKWSGTLIKSNLIQ